MNAKNDFPHSACHYIGNEWVRANATIAVTDPSTGETFTEIARGNDQDIGAAVSAARQAFDGAWSALAPAERGRALHRVAEVILENQESIARITARDGGKLLAQARADTTAN